LPEKSHVLVLDDEQIVVDRLKASLEKSDFEVDSCTSSEEAIRKLESGSYDILVTDLKMSGVDGLVVLRRAKKINPMIKAVVITGFATKDTFDEVMKSGAVEFIAKPFKMKQLRNILLNLRGEGETQPLCTESHRLLLD
jgi:DNA-binding NtrC family response regulator